jgi:hypothetical protein
MSTYGPEKRSFELIGFDDLKRLSVLAQRDLSSLFRRNPALGAIYEDRLLALTLCQGAAEHFVKPGRGVNDFDVWAFYRSHPERKFPYRRRGTVDFGESKFGRNPEDHRYAGRRIDVIGRDIRCEDGEDSMTAIRRWITFDKGKSAAFLAERPVVLIYPDAEIGRLAWNPIGDMRDNRSIRM